MFFLTDNLFADWWRNHGGKGLPWFIESGYWKWTEIDK